ncbi:MAG: hypothetical protein U5Q03_13000 [Bacteroidota bacterium]|nr:hypothetical protein [Bacteroidota bacterium]
MIPDQCTSQLAFVSDKWEECFESIRSKWQEGYVISSAGFGDPYYFIVMDQGTGWGKQDILISKNFPQLEINDYWDRKLDMSHVFHDGKQWFVIFTANTAANGQEWQYKQSWEDIKRFIRTLWGQKRFVSAAYQYQGNYFMLMSGGPERKEKWLLNREIPDDVLSGDYMKELNMFISCITEVDGKIFTVFSGGTGISEQFVLKPSRIEDVAHILEENWLEDLFISDIAFVRNELYLVFSQFMSK